MIPCVLHGGEKIRARSVEVCCQKVVHFSRAEARKVARWLLIKKGRRLRPYRCKVCGMYHLTGKRA